MNTLIIPPIKINGKKTKLVPWIKENIPSDLNIETRFIEPFFGSGIVGFNMGFQTNIVNDINPHIIKFYENLLTKQITPSKCFEYLSYEGKNLQLNGEQHFLEIRKRFNNSFSSLDFLFITKCCFNGLMRFNKKGEFNSPFCKNSNKLSIKYIDKVIKEINNTILILDNSSWKFECSDFEKVISTANKNDFIYCDPPYLGTEVTYHGGYTIEDEKRLVNCLENSGCKFMVSSWLRTKNEDNPVIKQFWSKYNIVEKQHKYHIGSKLEYRNDITEILIKNF